MQQEYISIGILGKPHGTSGAFHFKLTAFLAEDADMPDVLFVKSKQGILPYFVADWSLKNDTLGTISFEDVTTRELGVKLVNAELMVKAADFDNYFEAEEESPYIGCVVTDEVLGQIGTITEVTDNTVQEVAVVQYGEHQVMFPLVEQFIIKEDLDKKTLLVRLPEGLIDAYTNNTADERDDED